MNVETDNVDTMIEWILNGTAHRFVLDVRPGDVSNNSRLVPQQIRGRYTGRLVDSTEYRDGLRVMALQVRSDMNARGLERIEGPVEVWVTTYWPTEAGDVDATSKAALDCLQQAGLIVNDRQCRPVHLDRAKDPDRPRIEIVVCPRGDRDG